MIAGISTKTRSGNLSKPIRVLACFGSRFTSGDSTLLVAFAIFGSIVPGLAMIVVIVLSIGYIIWYPSLFRNGMTPGKKVMGCRVIGQETGDVPGFGLMLLGEFSGWPLNAINTILLKVSLLKPENQ